VRTLLATQTGLYVYLSTTVLEETTIVHCLRRRRKCERLSPGYHLPVSLRLHDSPKGCSLRRISGVVEQTPKEGHLVRHLATTVAQPPVLLMGHWTSKNI
jgi:hypothetical protein